jgi:predicted transcriptional regulator
VSSCRDEVEAMPRTAGSIVVTLRVPAELDRRIEREARRRRRAKSAVVREALQAAFGSGPAPPDPAREARRQSLLVSGRASEREALAFIDGAADTEGWR